MAFRILNPVTNVLNEDSDDDGETSAGEKLLQLLRTMNEINVLMVVSRRYGGVNLGPGRFRYIKQVAGELIRLVENNDEANIKNS